MLTKKEKVWTSKDNLSAKNLRKVSMCHRKSYRKDKMWPVPLTWNVMQLLEIVGDGMIGKHQRLWKRTTQWFSCCLISYTGFYCCCCCILTRMCRGITSSAITLQSTFAVKVQIDYKGRILWNQEITAQHSSETEKFS